MKGLISQAGEILSEAFEAALGSPVYFQIIIGDYFSPSTTKMIDTLAPP